MQTSQLIKRNLAHYWRTNFAVVLGVATAVAVLAGALLVGDSVRASLRDLVAQRLGNTDFVIAAPGFFREQLASDIQNHQQFAAAGFAKVCPLIAVAGTVTHEPSKRVGTGIRVYGVDERFWTFHGHADAAPHNREVLVSDSLARDLGAHTGDALVLRVEKPSEIPVESLHSKKEDLGRTLRLTMRAALSANALGEFSLQSQQSETRAVFVPLKLLQRELEQEGKANLVLLAGGGQHQTPATTSAIRTEALHRIVKDTATLSDYGVKLRVLHEQQVLAVESTAGMVSDPLAEKVDKASRSANSSALPYLSYLINSIRREDGRAVPYSIVASVDSKRLELMQHNELGHLPGCDASAPRGSLPATANLPPILLNDWAASDLQVKIGDRITLEYYVWLAEGKLATRSAEFRVGCIIPMKGDAADRDLVPDYPGITESETLGDWDPPFPIDLKRVRPQDEDYWKKYRTTPKGFIELGVAQSLWQSRFGKVTSLRVSPAKGQTLDEVQIAFERSLRETLDPLQDDFSIQAVRAQGLEASRGATDFGEYFLYFSFFLVISALMLTGLFFKLGIEQRLREIGVLQAVGFPAGKIRALFLFEGTALAVIGAVLGLAGALGYAALMMWGLRTWWVNAVGTTNLALHVAPLSLLLGAAGGILAAVLCVTWTLRRVGKESTRSLLAGVLREGEMGQGSGGATKRRRLFTSLRMAIVLSVIGGVLLLAAGFHLVGQVTGFFAGGLLLLAALLCYQSAWLRRGRLMPIHGSGWWPVSRLGFRNATYRPGRSVLCIALIASAAFIIVSVDAFRRRDTGSTLDRKSGSGGYPLLAESLLPIVHDPNTDEGREALNLTAEDSASPVARMTLARFRVRPGDDASCLNLYQPRNPKIIAPTDDFIRDNRFEFQDSIATGAEEKANPWLLLNREFPDGAIPVIADANSMTYVLHLKLGEDLVLPQGDHPVRLRVVAALSDSVFQSELIMAEKNFLRVFPEQEGYRFFLIDTPGQSSPEQAAAIATALEDRLSDFGFDVVPTAERLASFHRVENTYLSTFQMLGGLGLVLGTLGMAAVLLRNVLERRRELALLRAVGYNPSHFSLMIIAENAFLLCCGLFTGMACALLAIAPVFFSRGARLPGISLGVLLLAVVVSGLTASVVATRAVLKSPLLPALRAE
ncbi:MAG: putative transport system permease protein [Blastocatellia bacterium]|jgi:ABC-type antimicrobial peptide transport system permease subunit|nr:putative transport system permease protein [Blastocatellia bacterium]